VYTPLLSDRLCDPPGHRLVLAVLVVRKMGCPKGTLESEKISFVVATNVLAHRVGK